MPARRVRKGVLISTYGKRRRSFPNRFCRSTACAAVPPMSPLWLGTKHHTPRIYRHIWARVSCESDPAEFCPDSAGGDTATDLIDASPVRPFLRLILASPYRSPCSLIIRDIHNWVQFPNSCKRLCTGRVRLSSVATEGRAVEQEGYAATQSRRKDDGRTANVSEASNPGLRNCAVDLAGKRKGWNNVQPDHQRALRERFSCYL